MVRMVDVAKLAKVSPTAVSFVLNGRHDQLSDETISRVEEAIRQLGYHPSRLARGLATKRTETIGVLVGHLRHAVHMFIVSAIVGEARQQGYHVMIWDEVVHVAKGHDEASEREELLQVMLSQGVDGIISCVPLVNLSTPLERTIGAVPLVSVDQTEADYPPLYDSVSVDWADGAYQAVRHLASLGRERLLLAGWGAHWNARFQKRVKEEGLGVTLTPMTCSLRPDMVFDAVTEAFRVGDFDSIFVASDWGGAGVYRALEAMHKAIPRDVAVVSFDDTFGGFFSPALTSVSQPFRDIGTTALHMLLERIQGSTIATRHVQLSPRLVVRESCGQQQVDKRSLTVNLWGRDQH